ncbi:sodium:solute symporter family protein [Poriferisphaera sp. WC338]|uniref:sodium:solute symporter family protein n=1 Tax=Poriferisphaera sp. WC338 TaxID=3425129 RepID=UPI003D81B32C
MFPIILFSAFILLLIIIGLWGMRKTTNLNDFILGGRDIGPWFSAMSFGTAYFSAVLFVGFAGVLGWRFGLSALWIAAGNAFIGSLACWLILGPRARTMSHNLAAMTLPSFLHARFDSKTLRVLASLVIFVFLLPYSASVYKGLSYLFEAVFNIDYHWALILMAGTTAIYLSLGGYFAATFIDFCLGMIMILGCVLMVAFLIYAAGEPTTLIPRITEAYNTNVPPNIQPPVWSLAALVFMTSFGTWGLPQMSQKFFALKDPKLFTRGAFATALFAAIIGTAAYFTGAMLHLFYNNNTVPRTTVDSIKFDQLIPQLFQEQLPQWLTAIILLLMFAASMSTLTALIMTSASAVVVDFIKPVLLPNLSEKKSLLTLRLTAALFIAFSCIIALYQFSLILTLTAISWGAVAGCFMGILLYSLFSKHTTKAAIITAIPISLTTMIALTLYWDWSRAMVPLAACIAMIVPLITIPLISRFTPKPDHAQTDLAFQSQSNLTTTPERYSSRSIKQ